MGVGMGGRGRLDAGARDWWRRLGSDSVEMAVLEGVILVGGMGMGRIGVFCGGGRTG